MGWTKPCFQTVYRYAPTVDGWNRRVWNAGDGDSVPHAPVDTIFTGPVDPVTGFPTHTNPPTAEDTQPGPSISTSDFPSDGSDQLEVWGWIYLDAPALIRDGNTNSGELGEIWVGQCGGSPFRGEGYNDTVNTGGGALSGLLDPTPLPAGVHYVYGRLSDLSAFAGIQIQESVNGGGTWANVTATTTAPVVECTEVPCCDPIPEGWDVCPPVECAAVHAVNPSSGGGGDATVSTLVPVPDNEADASIRTGIAGTTGELSDAGHNHPIVRQTAVADPIATISGPGSLVGAVVMDRWSDEETVAQEIRYQVNVPVGDGWTILTVPTIAGFQQPRITVGTYRTTSPAVQKSQGNSGTNDGAGPNGPFMGAEAHHWASTRRVYLAYYRVEQAYTIYVSIGTEYTRL